MQIAASSPPKRRQITANLHAYPLAALLVLLVFGLLALFAPHIAPYDPAEFGGRPLERPSAAHLLGTNDAGQDIVSELIYGARVTLIVAFSVAFGTTALGALIGGAAGYLGGWFDALLMRALDVLLALPRLPLLILIITLLGGGLPQMIVTMIVLFTPGMARILRAEVQTLRSRTYLKMARQFGASPLYTFRRHVQPHLTPLLVYGIVTTASHAAALEAGLAFLGLGDPLAKSWGLMMRYALNLPGLLLTDRWLWWLLPPGMCITLLILALTFTGMSLEKRLKRAEQSA